MKMEIDVAIQLKAGKGIAGKDGALTPLIKQQIIQKIGMEYTS